MDAIRLLPLAQSAGCQLAIIDGAAKGSWVAGAVVRCLRQGHQLAVRVHQRFPLRWSKRRRRTRASSIWGDVVIRVVAAVGDERAQALAP